jgi:hypothetical protein
MEHINHEISQRLCEFLPLTDLPNLRLVNKAFAAVGAIKLFRQLTFHASNPSFNRILAAATHLVFRRYVKILIWDANVWDHKFRSFEEWEKYMKEDAWAPKRTNVVEKFVPKQLDALQPMPMGIKPEMEIASELRRQWLIYGQNLREETDVLKHCLDVDSLRQIFGQLSSLEEIRIVNGNFRLDDGEVIKDWGNDGEVIKDWGNDGEVIKDWGNDGEVIKDWGNDGESKPSPSGHSLLARGEGSCWTHLQHGPPAEEALKRSIRAAGDKLKVLSVDHLSWISFTVGGLPDTLHKHCPNVVALKLVFTTTEGDNEWNWIDDRRNCYADMQSGQLKRFISGLQKLERLHIVFPPGRRNASGINSGAAACLVNVIPSQVYNLRSLAVEGVDTSESFFINIVQNNATTLDSIHLHNIYLKPAGSWIRIFNTIRRQLGLKVAELGGHLCDSADIDARQLDFNIEDGWNLELNKLGAALSKYLVDGGACPLKHNLKEGVRLGTMDPVEE